MCHLKPPFKWDDIYSTTTRATTNPSEILLWGHTGHGGGHSSDERVYSSRIWRRPLRMEVVK